MGASPAAAHPFACVPQTSAFGAFLDVAVDLATRGLLWSWAAPGGLGAAVLLLEAITFVCTHAVHGAVWKAEVQLGPTPPWVRAVMANGFKTPAGCLAVAGLMGCPLWLWARRALPPGPWGSPAVGAVLVLGRLLAAAVEVWVVWRHLRALLQADAAAAAASAAVAAAGAVLLIVASGYCITRSDLGPHKQHVIFVPSTVLVTGLITDYSFYALQSSPDADTYDLSTMGTLAASVWFICSVLNLAALILSWMYIFEALAPAALSVQALGKETRTLEDDYKRRTGKAQEERHAAAVAELQAAAAMAGHPGYAALGSGPAAAAPASAPPPPVDVEAGGEGETVAEHMQYTVKMRLLSRFGKGVAAYLVADICVLLLPAFFNHVVQSTLQALLFVCYYAFVIVLLVLFRPQEQSSYLMVGFSEEDAEARGVNQLATGIAMAELGADSSDDEGARLGPGGPASSSAAGGPSSGGGGGGSSAASARAAARAAKAAARAAKKAGADGDRYRALPALPTSSPAAAGGTNGSASGGGAAALPVSTMTADPAYGSGGVIPPPPPYRGRQPRTFVPQQPVTGPRQFTLDDDEDEGDEASRPLTGAGGKSR
ncbi:hypothetical protein GPECTOR_7g930 [Gonium pectorale]|uniref:Uncharacterized protein n=1 Tax=Gonium pectorale TaxID=33097 RepID=A0A150GVV2_GONPE|nr:hypothetical protein GPECTOR_7g930 [Gonium pectorale]|eukprot:KXZ53480.1 hypothetical protein GPECTOR_7g930 [Gonium pectorale]